MVLLGEGRGRSDEGLRILNKLYQDVGSQWDIEENLEKVYKNARTHTWIPVLPNVEGFHFQCQTNGHDQGRLSRMPWSEDEEVYNCEYCMWIYYFIRYCRKFNLDI